MLLFSEVQLFMQYSGIFHVTSVLATTTHAHEGRISQNRVFETSFEFF